MVSDPRPLQEGGRGRVGHLLALVNISYDICVYHFWFLFFGPWGVLLFHMSRVTEACPVPTDLIIAS